MSRSTMNRPVLYLLALALVLAACTQAGPAAEEPSPTPAATPVQPSPSPEASPSPAAEPTQPAPTATPVVPDDPYDPGGGSATATPAGEATVSVATSAEQGDYLVGPDGLALYVFTEDEPGVSNCSGGCAEAWPPLTVAIGETPGAGSGVTGTLATIERDDGSHQVTYNNQPLYYFASDTEPGDTTGHEVGGVWFLATP